MPESSPKQVAVNYTKLSTRDRRKVREAYVDDQKGMCMYCKGPLLEEPSAHVLSKKINWNLFPKFFMNHPVHLQHCHKTGMTEGAVHAYCNAVLWQYEGR